MKVTHELCGCLRRLDPEKTVGEWTSVQLCETSDGYEMTIRHHSNWCSNYAKYGKVPQDTVVKMLAPVSMIEQTEPPASPADPFSEHYLRGLE